MLLSCIMKEDWTEIDEETDLDVCMARQLMIEMIGGEPGAQLREQFA